MFAGSDWWTAVSEAVNTEYTDETGGAWLDQEAGEFVVMVDADDANRVLKELRALVDDEHAQHVTCMQAEYTTDELGAVQQQAMERLGEVGGSFTSGTDAVRNRVEVEVEGDVDEAREALGDLADHPALSLQRPVCADVVPPPHDAVPLPGDGSTCMGMDALTVGTLVGDVERGCLWFERDEGRRTAIVWPRGWWLAPDGTVHDHRGNPRAQVGDAVEAGGGSVPAAAENLPQACRGDGEAWVLSSLERS